MKTIKKIAAAIAAALCICSCTQELQQPEEVKESYLLVSPDTLTLIEGESAALKATYKETVQSRVTRNEDVTSSKETQWHSSDSDIAEVEKGRVTAIGHGKAEIMAVHGQKEEKTIVIVLPQKTEEADKDDSQEPEGDEDESTDKENEDEPENNEQDENEDIPYTKLTTSLPERLDTVAVTGERMVIEFDIKKDDREEVNTQIEGLGATSISLDIEENKGTLSFVVGQVNPLIYLCIFDNQTTLFYEVNVKRLWVKPYGETEHKASAEASNISLSIKSNIPQDYITELIKTDTGCDWINITQIKSEIKPGNFTLVAEIEPNDDNRERNSDVKIWIGTAGGRSEEVTYTVTQEPSNIKKDGYVWFECLEMKKATVEKYDKDGDGEISYEEADDIIELDLKDRGVTSTVGIEHMHRLEKLDIRGNRIPEGGVIDLSGEHYWFNEIYNDNSKVTIDFTGCAVEVNGEDGTILENRKVRTNQYVDGFPGNCEETYTSSDFSRNGETVVLWNHTQGDGIPVLLKGQYFVDVDVTTGYYDKLMKEVTESIFSVEPYKSFREYFDVSYEINIDEKRLPKAGPFSDAGYEYGTYIINVSSAAFGAHASGYSTYISLHSFTMDKYVVAHEFGHSFGRLKDEYGGLGYYEYGSQEGPNVSYTDDPEKVPWARFLKDNTYKHYVGIYEGAASYSKDAWRPSQDSIMRQGGTNNTYNAPSRYEIFKNIMGLSHYMLNKYGEGFTEDDFWNEFVEYDVINLRDKDKITPVIP